MRSMFWIGLILIASVLTGCNPFAKESSAPAARPPAKSGPLPEVDGPDPAPAVPKKTETGKGKAVEAKTAKAKGQIIIKMADIAGKVGEIQVILDTTPYTGFMFKVDPSDKSGSLTLDTTVGEHKIEVQRNEVPIFIKTVTVKPIAEGPLTLTPTFNVQGAVILQASAPISPGVDAWIQVDNSEAVRWPVGTATFDLRYQVGFHNVKVYTTAPIKRELVSQGIVFRTDKPNVLKVGP